MSKTLKETVDAANANQDDWRAKIAMDRLGGIGILERTADPKGTFMFQNVGEAVAKESGEPIDSVRRGAQLQLDVIEKHYTVNGEGDFEAYTDDLNRLAQDPRYSGMDFHQFMQVFKNAPNPAALLAPAPAAGVAASSGGASVQVEQYEEAAAHDSIVRAGFDPDTGLMDFLALMAMNLDVNGDGIIGGSREDLHAALDAAMLAKFDVNGDGVVGLGILQSIIHARADQTFDRIDINGDGRLGAGVAQAIIVESFGEGQDVMSVGAELMAQTGMQIAATRLGASHDDVADHDQTNPIIKNDMAPV